MIIGYSILYVDDDTNIKDALWTRRVVYSTWDKALDMAFIKANEVKSKYGDEVLYVSLSRADSNMSCKKNGNVIIFRFISKQYGNEFGNIYIVPVYDD